MYLKTIRDIAKPQQFAVIDLLKRSVGMPVAAMARALGLSYMGVKKHCLDLEKKGFLETWRVPVSHGRPEKHYRLTEKADGFFPEAGNVLTLEILKAAERLHGPGTAESLLRAVHAERADRWRKKVKGRTVAERAASLAQLRAGEGHFASTEYHPQHGLCVVEYHSPVQRIADVYPVLLRIEEEFFGDVLRTAVRRSEERAGGVVRSVFAVSTLGHP